MGPECFNNLFPPVFMAVLLLSQISTAALPYAPKKTTYHITLSHMKVIHQSKRSYILKRNAKLIQKNNLYVFFIN